MSSYSQLPVYQATYSLLFAVCRTTTKVPRDMKYTYLSELKRFISEVIVIIYRVSGSPKERVDLIDEAIDKVVMINLYLTLMADLRGISSKLYGVLSLQTEGILKQFIAWQKFLKKAPDSKKPDLRKPNNSNDPGLF